MSSPMPTITSPGPVQVLRRIGTPGMPPALLPGQLAINDLGDNLTLARLYGGTAHSALYTSGVAVLVSNTRQVELTGIQTITGDKFIDVLNLHITGGSHGDVLVTDGLGNLDWIAGGGGVFPEAPTDGQVYGRDGFEETWVPVLPLTGGTITGDLNVLGNLEINGDGVVSDAPFDGLMYVRANGTWVILPWEWPGGGGGAGGSFPEAPPTGLIYGRNGQSTSWVPVLPLSGGQMTGTLVLNGPPAAGSPPNQAATVGYVNSMLTGALQFLGTMNATTNIVTYTTASGLPAGPLVPAGQNADRYIIVTTAGVLTAPPYLAGQQANVGDWLISDGAAWNLVSVGTGATTFASNVIVSPPVAGTANVQATLQQLLSMIGASTFPEAPTTGQTYGRIGLNASWNPVLPINGGTMLGDLILNGPPGLASPPNQAATKGYVDGLVTGALQFLGTMDATTGDVTYTSSSGLPVGPLVPPEQAADQYVIASNTGTVPSGPIAGTDLEPGDWIISDGVTWNVISASQMTILASSVTVGPAVLGATDVQGALTALASAVGTLQAQVSTFLTSVSTIGDISSFGQAGP